MFYKDYFMMKNPNYKPVNVKKLADLINNREINQPGGFGRAPAQHELKKCPICSGKMHSVGNDLHKCEMCTATFQSNSYKFDLVCK